MDSPDGKRMRKSLESVSAEESQCLGEFRIMLSHCQQLLAFLSEQAPTRGTMAKKRAIEDEQFILNLAALAQQCSYETKGYQLLLFFEKNENKRDRIIVDVSVMMYEWCEKLLGVSGKQLQDIAKRFLNQPRVVDINVARKKISDFFKTEKDALYDIRNSVGAHRDQDFMKQMEVFDTLSWSETLSRFHEFEKATIEFGRALKPLMDAGLSHLGKELGK